jgi:hypothetical protein
MGLQEGEAEAAAVATGAPRVSLASMEAKIAARYDFTGAQAIGDAPQMPSLALLSICLLVMDNGYTLIGKSAPVSAANFNADLGRKLAYEDAIRQVWPLEGYLLRSLQTA